MLPLIPIIRVIAMTIILDKVSGLAKEVSDKIINKYDNNIKEITKKTKNKELIIPIEIR